MPTQTSSPTIPITPILPHASWDADRILAKWGAPPQWDYGALTSSAPHYSDAGAGLFGLPPVGELLAFAKRVTARQQAHPALILLGTDALISQIPLPDVRAVLLPSLNAADPVAHHPVAASEWRDVEELALLVQGARTSRFPHLTEGS